MSADYWVTSTNPERDLDAESVNCTYNLGKMLRAAGFPDWRALIGAPTSEAGGMLEGVARRLRADPDKFRAYNPPNGWGTYEGAIEFCDAFAALCAAHPQATIGGWL